MIVLKKEYVIKDDKKFDSSDSEVNKISFRKFKL